jgi:hypothetical protein
MDIRRVHWIRGTDGEVFKQNVVWKSITKDRYYLAGVIWLKERR